MEHILDHLHAHARILESHHGDIGPDAERHQFVHPGAGVEQGFQLGLFVQHLLRRGPDHGVIGQRCAGRPVVDLGLRQRLAQPL